jgi:hypothetical protein
MTRRGLFAWVGGALGALVLPLQKKKAPSPGIFATCHDAVLAGRVPCWLKGKRVQSYEMILTADPRGGYLVPPGYAEAVLRALERQA